MSVSGVPSLVRTMCGKRRRLIEVGLISVGYALESCLISVRKVCGRCQKTDPKTVRLNA